MFSAENGLYGEINILISEKKPLWDTKDKLYHNSDIARKLWNEVATTDVGCESK